MRLALFLSLLCFLVGCAPDKGEPGAPGTPGTVGAKGDKGDKGDPGAQGYGAGILATAATTCPEGSNGGTQFTTFIDVNNDGQLDASETITSVSVVCGGLTGAAGQDGKSSRITVALASEAQCPAGGYAFTLQNGDETPSVTAVCNGTQGLQGLQGIAGQDGAPGSQVTPVKFCASDNSTFPEYGLRIGDDLFAVYWYSAQNPHDSTSFLAKLVPGSYKSTGGNGCYFILNSDLSVGN